MDFKINWTEQACLDLKEAIDYIALDNPQAAEKVGFTIIDRVELLSSMPHIGPVYQRRKEKHIRQINCEKHHIFYRINKQKNSIEIIRIRHSTRGSDGL